MDVASFRQLPILGILRGIKIRDIEPVIETVVSSGLGTIEIAMNTPQAADLIKAAVNASRNRLMIGAGTVLDTDTIKLSVDSGATFIVSPTTIPSVMDHCVKNVLPVFPGALTPSEIYSAWSQGATMVKVFPATVFGPSYIREVKGPFEKIELLACGGVGPDNIGSFFKSGSSAVAFGGSIFRRDWLDKGDFRSIGQAIKDLVASYLFFKDGVART